MHTERPVGFKEYRSRTKGKQKSSVLPDFFIGAIAEVNAPLMTDNARDFVSYFPDVELVTPPKPVAATPAVVADGAPAAE